jgi:hypothetical protein
MGKYFGIDHLWRSDRTMSGLAMLVIAAALEGAPRRQPQPRHYDTPIGPPAPVTRQVRRALERKAAKLRQKP